jgi:hypothetical protein
MNQHISESRWYQVGPTAFVFSDSSESNSSQAVVKFHDLELPEIHVDVDFADGNVIIVSISAVHLSAADRSRALDYLEHNPDGSVSSPPNNQLPRSERIWDFREVNAPTQLIDSELPRTPPPPYNGAYRLPSYNARHIAPQTSIIDMTARVGRDISSNSSNPEPSRDERVEHLIDAVHRTYEVEMGAYIPELPRVPTPLISPLASPTPHLLSLPLAGEFVIRREEVLRVLPAELESNEVTPPPSQNPIARALEEAQNVIDQCVIQMGVEANRRL